MEFLILDVLQLQVNQLSKWTVDIPLSINKKELIVEILIPGMIK